MDHNEYFLEWYAHDILERARAVARREALAGSGAPIVRPALVASAGAVRRLYERWSSAASAGSKPTTARA